MRKRNIDIKLEDISAVIRHETDAAWLIYDGSKNVWVPKSQVEIDPPNAQPRDQVTVTMPHWLAKDKGFI